MIEQRSLLLVPFPFSDQSGRKVRPVVVISNNNFNASSEDIIIIGITSNITKDQFTLNLNSKDLEEGRLMDSCCIKVENILKLDQNLIIKRIGKINKTKFNEIISILKEIIKPSE